MRPFALSRISRISLRWLAGAAALACAATLAPVAALASPARPATTASGPPACATSGLVIWLTSDGVAAGTAFYTLNFTNESGHACTLKGHPGVAAVSLAGHQVGAPAGWPPPAAQVVRLASNATAYALVSYSDVIVGNSGPSRATRCTRPACGCSRPVRRRPGWCRFRCRRARARTWST